MLSEPYFENIADQNLEEAGTTWIRPCTLGNKKKKIFRAILNNACMPLICSEFLHMEYSLRYQCEGNVWIQADYGCTL